jgi:hypothetical protein
MANLWQRIVKQQMVEEHESVPQYQWDTYAKAGWHKREQVAEALECHEDKVQTVLKSAITSGKIERREITIWDKLNKELVKVVAYREKGKENRKPETGNLNGERKPETGNRKPETGKRGRPKSKRPKPVAGMTVRSRRGGMGKITEIVRGRMRVDWDSGKVTEPAVKAIAKGDIYLEF